MTAKHITIGPDVDLSTEDVRLADGSRLTAELAERIAQEALAKHPARRGRPSITGDCGRTPKMTIRVTPGTRKALETIAARQGRHLADVSRDALDEYSRRHGERG